jgi:hypothetical protein
MRQIRIVDISGATYPVDVFIADVYGNYQTYLGTITSGTEPNPPFSSVNYTTQIPPIFNTAPAIMLLLVDSNGCRIFKILDCTFGCYFDITIELANCNFTLNISPRSCDIGINLDGPQCEFGLNHDGPIS